MFGYRLSGVMKRKAERLFRIERMKWGLIMAIVLFNSPARAHSEQDEHKEDKEEEEEHEGTFSRLSLGLGFGGYSGSGKLDPVEGVRLVQDPSHSSPALNIAFDIGGGIIDNLAIHVGVAFETLFISDDDPSIDGFYLFGIGGGATYYFMPMNLYLSGHIRWAGALLYLPNAPCDVFSWEKLEGFSGIGLSLAFGKEWFNSSNSSGFGIGLQANYAYLGGPPDLNYFSILIMPTLTSF